MDTTFKRCYVLTEDSGSVFSPCHEDQSELQVEAEVILTLTLKLAVPPSAHHTTAAWSDKHV